MSLQIALIIMGISALLIVATVSLMQTEESRKKIFAPLKSWAGQSLAAVKRTFVGSIERLKPRGLAARLSQREPSLMPSGDFAPGDESQSTPIIDRGLGSKTGVDTHDANSVDNHSLPIDSSPQPLKIDYWVRLPGEGVVTRDLALSVFREHEITLERPRAVHGRTEPGNAWLDLTSAQSDEVFSDLILSLQMATRGSVTNESELTRFNNLAYQMAESLGRPINFDMSIEEALPEAARLARFCDQFDLVAVIHIEPKPGTGFQGVDVSRALDRAGMRLGKDDLYHLFDARTGVSRFSLTNRSESGSFSYEDLESGVLRGLVLYMNVPRVARPSVTFSDLVSVAQYVCVEIDGTLTDPEGEAINEAHFDAIRRQIRSLEGSMKKYGIDPGSEEARRLF